jgi:hypothetical protein
MLVPACSGTDPDQEAPNASAGATTEPVHASTSAAPSSTAAAGGNPSDPAIISPLSQQDLEGAQLDGELACTFSTDEATFLLVQGYAGVDEPTEGIAKIGGTIERVSSPGGFNAMVQGARFAAADATIRIQVTGSARDRNVESPPLPATLTYQGNGGSSRSLQGDWTCGP